MTKTELINKVMLPLKNAGFEVYFVGGCVRDEVLGIEPHDFDITTNATPEDIHKVFDRVSNVSKNSEAFGVTMPLITFDNGEMLEVEIATFRTDTTEGRHPEVKLVSTMAEDAARRDFTCNALYEDAEGHIYDPTHFGKDDIKNGVLRFVGNAQERLNEDPLRALRMVRFMSKFGFVLADKNFKVNSLEGVSKERILKEITGIFKGSYLWYAFYCGYELGVWDLIPVIRDMLKGMKDTQQNPKWHSEGNVFEHTMLVLRNIKTDGDYILGLAAFLHDCGKPIAAARKEKKNPTDDWYKMHDHDELGIEEGRRIMKELGMSNKDIKDITWLIGNHMKAHRMDEMKKHDLWALTSNPLFEKLVKLAIADTAGSVALCENEWIDADEMIKSPKVLSLMKNPGKSLEGLPMPKPLVTGDDLIKRGYEPSTRFKHALEIMYNHQIDFGTTDKEQLLIDVKSYMKGN